MSVLPPGRKYEEILDKERISVTISHPLAIDIRHYAHELGMSVSEFVQQACIDRIKLAQEEINERPILLEDWQEKHDRAIDRIVEECKLMHSGVLDRKDLDKANDKEDLK